jgi:DNA-binding beta-propeller fold protein YncE
LNLNTSLTWYAPTSFVFVITGSQVVASPRSGCKQPAVNPRTGYVYIPSQFSDNVSILLGTKIVATASVTLPGAAAVNPATGYVYVVDQYKTGVTILSGTQVVTRLETGFPASTRYAPVSGYNPPQNATLEVNPTYGYVYLLHDCCHALTVISGTSLLGTIEVGARPRSVSANPDTGLVYVANDLDQNVTVIQDLIVPRVQTLSSLFTPDDDLAICFSGAVLTSTINFQLEPTLPFAVDWSPEADCATISHATFQMNRPYTLSVKPGGQSPAGLVVVAKDFTFRYYPYRWLLPRLDRFVY